jgi:uncharacterized membrane protein
MINAPIKTRIMLPVEATIISLNQVPEMIEISDNRVELLMKSSLTEVIYVIGVVGTEEHARIVLSEAETVIMYIKNSGINITLAEAKIQEANFAFNLGNFVDAETWGYSAKDLAIHINQTAAQAKSKIEEAEQTIVNIENRDRKIELNEAQDLLDQAHDAYDNGEYIEAINLANQAITKIEEIEIFLSEETDLWFIYVILGAIALASIAILGLVFARSRRKLQVAEVKKKKQRIDLERIFLVHKDLLPEEKQAIQFLVENNGEAFEAELYDYLKLPRTTTWRLVKRLDRMDIIKRSKFRRQNLLRIRRKFYLKK